MATTQDYKDYILDNIKLDDITIRPMMGEYLLYYKGVLIGGLYDNRLLIKKLNKKYNLQENIPYEGAKPMYLINPDDKLAKEIIINTYEDLKNGKV